MNYMNLFHRIVIVNFLDKLSELRRFPCLMPCQCSYNIYFCTNVTWYFLFNITISFCLQNFPNSGKERKWFLSIIPGPDMDHGEHIALDIYFLKQQHWAAMSTISERFESIYIYITQFLFINVITQFHLARQLIFDFDFRSLHLVLRDLLHLHSVFWG